MQSVTSRVEVRDVAPGLWIWRVRHHHWKPSGDWEPVVTSTFVESGGERLLLDPLVPPPDAVEVWKRIDERPPTIGVVLLPDHVRDIDQFVDRYHVRAFGPMFFFRDDIPRTELEPIRPDTVLPGGLVAQYDGRGRGETPLWLPEQRMIVFGDGADGARWHTLCMGVTVARKTGPTGLARIARASVRKSDRFNGEPVHDRKAYERALELPPFEG